MNRVDMFIAFLDQVCDQLDKVMISGDFNMAHISWNNTGETPSTNNSLIEALNDHLTLCVEHVEK